MTVMKSARAPFVLLLQQTVGSAHPAVTSFGESCASCSAALDLCLCLSGHVCQIVSASMSVALVLIGFFFVSMACTHTESAVLSAVCYRYNAVDSQNQESSMNLLVRVENGARSVSVLLMLNSTSVAHTLQCCHDEIRTKHCCF